MIQTERQLNKQLFRQTFPAADGSRVGSGTLTGFVIVVGFGERDQRRGSDDVVDLRDRGGDEEREEKGDDVV